MKGIAMAVVFSLIAPSRGWADDTDIVDAGDEFAYETEVVGYRLRRTDETTGFAQTIDVADQRKSLASTSDVISQSVGVQVRTMGGLGTFGSASIRGSTPNQVPVFLDRVQLNMGGSGVVNLGDFSLDLLESIELYRGTAPVSLGTSGIGGAIVLRTLNTQKPVSEAGVSFGSWNTWRVFALSADVIGPIEALALFSGQGSDGNFVYFNRNGTDFNTDDDVFEERTNNHHGAYFGLIKLNTRFGAWEFQLMDDFFIKRQGLPGLDSFAGVSHAELRTQQNTVHATVGRSFRETFRIDSDAAYLLLREDFDDLAGDIGIGHQRAKYASDAVSGAAVLRAELSARHVATLRIGGRYEQYRQNEMLLPREDQQSPSYRRRGEAALEHEWIPVSSLQIVPAIRTEVHYSSFGGGPTPALLTNFEASEVTDYFFSPSLGVRYDVLEGLTLRANGGRYVRTPELTELFGDRGAVIGNPELLPEVGYNVDAGVTYVAAGIFPQSLLRVDVAWFGGWVDDMIALEPNSQSTSHPVNLDAARIQGFESALHISVFKLVRFSGNYTYFYGINRSEKTIYWGKRLPGRSPHEVYGRIDISTTMTRFGAAGWFDIDYASKAFVGSYNDEAYAAKHFFLGMGSRLESIATGLSLTMEIKNLLDSLVFRNDAGSWLPMSDYNRYPLPGRTVLVTLHWKIQ